MPVNYRDIKLLIFDLDGSLVRFKCDWKLIKELRAKGEYDKADELELKGALDSQPIDEMINVLVQFQGPKALFSMNKRKAVEAALDKFILKDQFNMIVTRDDVINPKPNPEGLQLIYNKFSYINKEEIIYVGDRSIDLMAGKRFNILATTPISLMMNDSLEI